MWDKKSPERTGGKKPPGETRTKLSDMKES